MATPAGESCRRRSFMDAVCAGSAVYSAPDFASICRPASLTCSLATAGRRTAQTAQLTIVREAQRARGVPLDERLVSAATGISPALIVPRRKNKQRSDNTRRGVWIWFRLRRTVGTERWRCYQRVCAVWHGTANTGGSGVWIWLR